MVDSESAVVVPPAEVLTVRVKLSIRIFPPMSCQIAELAHAAKAVVGWAIDSGNAGVEIATKDCRSLAHDIAD
jgi:hypothetical protein